MEPIHLRFTLTQRDYSRAISAYNLSSRRTQIILGVLGTGVTLVVCGMSLQFMQSQNVFSTRFWVQIGIVVFAIAYVIYRLFVMPTVIARRFNKAVLQQTEFHYQFGEDYFHASNLQAESKVSWDFFNQALEANEFYFLTHKLNKSQYSFIPKRAFESPEQETAFRATVEKHLGPIKN